MSRPADSPKSATAQPADEPMGELSALRDVQPPPALVARVMTHVTSPPVPTLWQWLRRPFRVELRISPVGALGLTLGLAVGLGVLVARSRIRPVAAPTVADSAGGGAPASGTVLVRFVLEARGARRVAVAGSFNDWRTDAVMLEDAGDDGRFVATVALPPGLHEYMFVVDGQWVTDPTASERRPDGFGRQNALLRL
jgi:hypothetical protein